MTGDSNDSARDPDPLYNPAYLVFVYSSWALVNWLIGDWPGLLVLLAGTAVLTFLALRQHRPPEQRSFLVDFAVILLFCAAALGLGVLTLTVFSEWPALAVATVAFLLALVVGTNALRRPVRYPS